MRPQLQVHFAAAICGAFLLISPSPLAQVAWVPTFDQALKQAAAEEKFIVLDVSADWCPPCQQMGREVYPDRGFIDFSRSQVFILVDEQKDAEGTRLVRRFDVHVFPTLIVFDSKGEEINRLVGFRDAAGLIRDLQEIFADPEPFSAQMERAKKQTDDFALQLKVGKRSLERHDDGRARQFLSRAAALSLSRPLPERLEATALYSVASFRDGRYQDSLKAMDDLEKLDAAVTQSSEMRFQRARVLVALKKHDEAMKILTDLLRSSRSRSDADGARKLLASLPGKYRRGDKEFVSALEKAKENYRKGKPEAALELATRAVEITPQAAEAHLVLAAIHFQNAGRQADASTKNSLLSSGLNELRLARRLDPEDMAGYQSAKAYLASALVPQAPTSPEAQKSFAEAERLFAAQRYQNAVEEYQKTIQKEPDFGKAFLHLGDCFFATGHLEEALKWYRQAAVRAPLDAAAHRFAADTLERLGRSDEARAALIQSLLADPEYPLVWQDLERIARAEGRNLERHLEIVPFQFLLVGMDASSYDEQMFADVPSGTAPAWREYVKQKLLWRQEHFARTFPQQNFYHTTFAEELDCLTRLVEKWSAMRDDNASLRDEGLDFLRQVWIDGRLDAFVLFELFTEEYRSAFEAWKKQNPARAAAYIENYLLGAPQARSRGQYNSSAIEAYNAGLESQNGGDRVRAADQYRKALAQEPRMVPALHNLTLLYLEMNDDANAASMLRHWAEVEPDSPQRLGMQSQLEYRRGDYEEARSLLERAVSLEQNEENKARYRRNLSAIEALLERSAAPAAAPGGRAPAQATTGVDLQPAFEAISSGQYGTAIEMLEKLLPVLNGAVEQQATLMLAVAHFNLRHWKEARLYVTQYLEVDPGNETALELQEKVEEMLRR